MIPTRSRSPSPPPCQPTTPGALAVPSSMEQESRVVKMFMVLFIRPSANMDGTTLK